MKLCEKVLLFWLKRVKGMSSALASRVVLGGGCFWCLDAALSQLRGVKSCICGYAGGKVDAPDYAMVCSGTTGHAEVVEVTFDSAVLPFSVLLSSFFAVHDPTTRDRQGHDVGTQYRSVIFADTAEQKAAALETISKMEQEKIWPDPIVTEVVYPCPVFWAAEKYHQQYYNNNPEQPYCRAVVGHKVQLLRKVMKGYLA